MDMHNGSWLTAATARIAEVLAYTEVCDALDDNIDITQALVEHGQVDTGALAALLDARTALLAAVDELANISTIPAGLAAPNPDIDALLAEAEDGISHAARRLAASGNTIEMQLASEVVHQGCRTIARTRAGMAHY